MKTVLYNVAGCQLFRGCLNIEVNGRAVGTFRIVHYIVGVCYSGMSVKWGFSFSICSVSTLSKIQYCANVCAPSFFQYYYMEAGYGAKGITYSECPNAY